MKETIFAALTAGILASGNANAMIIDFENLNPGDINIIDGGEFDQNTPINGFLFDNYGHYDSSWFNSAIALRGADANFNGSQYLYFWPGMQITSGTMFSVKGFDLKVLNPAVDLNIIGITATNDIIKNTIDVTHTDVAHYDLTGFDNLFKFIVVFGDGSTQDRGYIDNFDLNSAIPEPSTYAMLLAGLGLMGFAGRKNQLKL